MAVPYVVRKKADLTSGERKELWYGVPKKLIDPIRNREFAEYMEKRSGTCFEKIFAEWYEGERTEVP